MPIKKSKHEENKIYSEIDLIERQFDETDERPILLTKTNESSDYNQIKKINDIDQNVIPLKIDDELQPHDSNVIIHSLEGNNEVIEDQLGLTFENSLDLPTNESLISAVEDQIIEKNQSFNPSESNGEKDDIKQKLKNKTLNQDFLDELGEFVPENSDILLPSTKSQLDSRIESNYCFKTEEFYSAISEYSSPLDSKTKQLVFKFISLTCYQVTNILFENIKGWDIYTEKTRITLVKCFTNLLFDLLEERLVSIIESKLKKNQRIIRSLNYVLDAINNVIIDKKNHKLNLIKILNDS
jgi:hypothetical protein